MLSQTPLGANNSEIEASLVYPSKFKLRLVLRFILSLMFVSANFLSTSLLSISLAQTDTQVEATSITFADTLAQASELNADVLTAKVDLSSSERDLARVKQDPLALRIPILQAEQAFVSAQQALASATLSAQNEAADAYASAKEADAALSQAQAQEAITQTQFEATQIRTNAGAATTLDLERAKNALESAQRDSSDAAQTRSLAYGKLASLLGLNANLILSDSLVLSDNVPTPEIPSLEDVLASLDSNSLIIRAQQALALAEAQYAAINNAFSSRSDIDAAKDSVSNAQTRLADSRRSIDVSMRQTYNAVLVAQSRVSSASAALATSQEDLNAQQLRYDAGSISVLELEQSKLNVLSASIALESSQHALASAVRQLNLALMGSAAL